MSSLSIAQFDRIPTIGALLGTQGPKEVLDTINSRFGGSSFFGSSDDPFATQHQYFIDNVIQPMQIVAQQFKQQFKEMIYTDENVIKPIVSLYDLEHGIPEAMWLPIALHPTVRKLGEERRIDMFGFDAKNLPEENVYQRLIDNGTVVLDAEELKKNGGTYSYVVEHWSTDPILADEELDAIEDTYEFLGRYYTGLDELYEHLGDGTLLKSKSYLQEGMQLRDLDVTSFPDKRG